MTDLKDKLTDAATRLGKGASGVAEDLQIRAEDAWDTLQYRTKRAVRKSSAYVHKHPVPPALAAFGFGLVLGLILNRRDSASFRTRYIAEPLHQSRGLLLGLLIACGTLLRRTLSSASNAVEEIAENVSDNVKDSLKPMRRGD